VLAALGRLYRAERLWPELLENLRAEAAVAETPAERARVRRDMGAILAGELASHAEAIEAYRLVLEEVPGDAEAIAAVRAIGAEREELRETAASVLVPVLRAGRAPG
jgi:tetratricopeptide (TPR) repeat protein